MESEYRHPTGDTGTGAVIGTWRTRTAQDFLAGVAAAETFKTAEAEVGVGEMVQPQPPPPHHPDGQKNWGGGQNGQEGGRSV